MIEGAATESVAPMPVRNAENPIKVDFRRFFLLTSDAIQARISLSMSVERLAHEDSSVAGQDEAAGGRAVRAGLEPTRGSRSRGRKSEGIDGTYQLIRGR